MPISFDNALGPHPAALALRAQRMNVIANNIAHADTPGYQARDLDFRAALSARLERKEGQPGAMRAWQTRSRHLPAPGAQHEPALKYRQPWMPSPDSNTVDVQIEQAALAENNIQWQAAYRFLNGKLTGLRTAIRGE